MAETANVVEMPMPEPNTRPEKKRPAKSGVEATTPDKKEREKPKVRGKRKGGKAARDKASKAAKGTRVSAEQLPRQSLEQALRVPRALHQTLAGGPATWEQIAGATGLGAGNQRNKYFLWSAQAYGLIEKDEDKFSLTEVGRKILAPTRPNEEKEAAVRAVMTPVVFSRFFTDYNGSPFPAEVYLGNVLESRYDVPRERVDEAKTLLRENGVYTGILRQEGDALVVRLDPATTGVRTPERAIDMIDLSVPETTVTITTGGTAPSSDFANMCFVITPIGADDSDQRKHANMILKNVIEPVVTDLGLTARRADQIERAGLITQQIFECLAKAKLCIADLSFSNPNAFYELGIRHMCKAPTVQIIRKGDPIPFDVSQGRTIKIDMTDVYSVMDSIESAKKELRQHLKHALGADYKGEDNPVNTYLPGVEVKLPS